MAKMNLLKKKTKTFISLLFIFTLMMLTGCGSAYEPNELSLVQFVGIDRGQENLLEVSFLIAIPQNLAGENSKGGEGSFLVTVSAPTVFQALRLANTFVGRRLSFIHAKGVIFSDIIAKEGLISKLLPTLLQFRETRGTAFVAITEDAPAKLMEKLVPLLEANPSRYMELLTQNYAFTGFISSAQVQDVYNELKILGMDSVVTLINLSPEKLPEGEEKGDYKPGGIYTAGELPKKGGVEIEAIGGAVLKDGKMVATLNGTETMIYNMIRGEFNSSFISLPVPQEEKAVINLEIFYARRPQIKIKLTEQGAVVDLELRFEGNVLGGGTTIDYALSEDRVILEEAVAKSLKREVEKLVAKSQALGSDILEFGLNARRLVKTVDEWNNLNWDVLFMNSQVNVKVDFKIRRTSTLFKHAPITTEIVGEGEE
jgi:spore germination protein KC